MDAKNFGQHFKKGMAEMWTMPMPDKNDLPPPPNFAVAIDELRQLLEKSKVFSGKAFIDEEDFYICTTKIRRYFSWAPGNHQLDTLENLVENAKVHAMGRALIDIANYRQAVEALAQSVGDAEKVYPSTESNQAEEIIRIAHLQAQTIIEAAHQEAQRIIEEARRRA